MAPSIGQNLASKAAAEASLHPLHEQVMRVA